MNNPVNQIIVKCQREDTSHARLTVFERSMKVEYGRTIPGITFTFLPMMDYTEILKFEDYPELRGIYQDNAWDIDEVAAFINPRRLLDVAAVQ